MGAGPAPRIIRGYRTWDLAYKDGTFRLFSQRTGFTREKEMMWEKETMAICPEGKLEQHFRTFRCTCGIYSYKSIEGILRELPTRPLNLYIFPTIGGVILSYGMVVEYVEGYRASHAMVDTIFVPPQIFVCNYCLIDGDSVLATFALADPEGLDNMEFTCRAHRWLAEEGFREQGIDCGVWYAGDMLEEMSRYYDAPLTPLPIVWERDWNGAR